jgi:tetratricopeptide (TPR) repeat protein
VPPRIATRAAVRIEDGRRLGINYFGAHWDFTRLLLDQVVPGPAADDDARQWYQTIAALFASEHQLSESRAHLERARRIFPADPQILAASGRLHETFAAPGLQLFVDTGSPANDLSIIIGSTRSNLRQAQAYFSRLVELDAASVEIRLHFGRVLGLQGRHDAAASELRRAAAAGDPLTQYYASLFLGVEEQALGQPDRARESFEAAAALYPLAQSPYLALSQLARRQGDRTGALGAIRQLPALPADDREDPWWTYFPGSMDEAQRRLSALRAVLFLTPSER